MSLLQYTVGVTKFDRHGYKARERMLVITDSAIYVLDAKDGKVKHRLPFNVIINITITKGADSMLLIRIPEEMKKEKGDVILECKFLIEALTWILDSSKNQQLVRIEDSNS